MKTQVLMLLILCGQISYAQPMPADSSLLKMMYGKYDSNGKTFTRSHLAEEPLHEYYPEVKYEIKFCENTIIENQNLLFVVCQAPIFYQDFHTFCLTDYFYFIKTGDNWHLLKAIVGNSNHMMIDADKFEIADIAPDKKALITTFVVTGNSADSKCISLESINLSGLTDMGVVDLNYSDEAFTDKESLQKTDECPITAYESTWEILKTPTEYFQIHVHKTFYTFSKGCIQKTIKSLEDMVYVYKSGQFRLAKD